VGTIIMNNTNTDVNTIQPHIRGYNTIVMF